MDEKLQPDRRMVRREAYRAVQALDALATGYREREDDLHRHENVVEGARANLAVAQEVAAATGPYYGLTGGRLTLEEVNQGPTISIFPGQEQTGIVAISTWASVQPLTDNRINTIWDRREDTPKKAILIARFYRKTPRQIIEKARQDVSRSLRTGHLKFLIPIFD